MERNGTIRNAKGLARATTIIELSFNTQKLRILKKVQTVERRYCIINMCVHAQHIHVHNVQCTVVRVHIGEIEIKNGQKQMRAFHFVLFFCKLKGGTSNLLT